MNEPKITFLGTGLMGSRMARHLLTAGYDVTVWNRTLSKAQVLAADGAKIASSAADAISGADVIVAMLADGPAALALQADPKVRAAIPRGSVWIEMGSIKPEEARAEAADLATLGVAFVDAPVSGGTKGAETASLAIMAGGETTAFERVVPILEVMGRPVHVGPTGTGQLAKLANQAIVAVTIGAVAEAMLLVETGGADPAAVRQALMGGFADSTILQQHGERMTSGNFVPGGLSRLQLKDLDNLLAEATHLGLELPVSKHIRDRFDHFCTAMEGGDSDHSGLYLELRERNGLETS